MNAEIVAAASKQLPEDVGKAGPLGLLLILLLLIATAFLVRSMTTHLRRLPRSFDPADRGPQVVVPDTPEELFRPRREPGQDLLDQLRSAPLAIEPPRARDDRPESPQG
ncbi:MAG TPA: hypothetical protein VGN47_15385 [Blastococcus sp.]|jgi:hypothetical protein|nr:hypothetical protein [Blastococcus sp.]